MQAASWLTDYDEVCTPEGKSSWWGVGLLPLLRGLWGLVINLFPDSGSYIDIPFGIW